MRNLVVSREASVRTQQLLGDCILVVCSSSHTAFVLEKATGELLAVDDEGTLLWRECLVVDTETHWVSAAYLEEVDVLVCIASKGSILQVSCEAALDGRSTAVALVDGGVLAVAWSPDQEMVVILTGRSSLLTLSLPELEPIDEVPIAPSILVEGLTSACAPGVVWKPDDGRYFVVSACEEGTSGSHRVLRIYERGSLTPHALGRHEDDSTVTGIMGSAVAWATDGSLIATAQEVQGRVQVIFFERNGLRHREFHLKGTEPTAESVDFLSWNSESQLLAVGVNPKQEAGVTLPGRVMLWHRDNYHWYLKYEERQEGKICGMFFDSDRPYVLHLILRGGLWRWLGLCWDFTVSQDNQHRTAAVVDGYEALLTPLDTSLIPPPMYHSKVSSATSSVFTSLAFSPMSPSSTAEEMSVVDTCEQACAGQRSVLAGLTADGHLEVFDEHAALLGSSEAAQLASVDVVGPVATALGVDRGRVRLRQLVVMTSRSFVTLVWHEREHTDALVELTVCKAVESAIVTCVAQLRGKALRVVNLSDGLAVVGLADGSVLTYECGTGKLTRFQHVLLEPCPWIGVAECRGSGPIVVGLSERSRLYAGEQLVCHAVSNFVISPWREMLMYVTMGSRPELRLVSFGELADVDLTAGAEDSHLVGLEPRALERGARLVTDLVTHPTVVLQMPRGNLEGVCPRAVVLHQVAQLLNRGRYGDALKLLRRQRVDLNILVDHDPARYERDVHKFIEQVRNVELLNLFVSSLHDIDTASRWPQTAGAEAPTDAREVPGWFPGNKRNRVCELVRQDLLTRDECKVLQPILTTYTRQDPPRLDEALRLVQRHVRDVRREALSGDDAARLIKYLAFFAGSMDTLFDTALELYDLELARAVARQSQRDPREYLPVLDRLQGLQGWRARAEIDLYLKRPASALAHMAEASGEHELDADHVYCLVDAHGLHQKALQLFAPQRFPVVHRTLLGMWAQRLTETQDHRGAMLAYLALAHGTAKENAEVVLKAAEQARQVGQWRTALNLVARVEGPATVKQWAAQLVPPLRDAVGPNRKQRLADCAVLLAEYLDDVDGAVGALVGAGAWAEAMRQCYRTGRQDLVETDVRGAAVDACDGLSGDLEGRPEAYTKVRERLLAVMQRRREDPGEHADGPADDAGSVFSAATSTASTAYSAASSSSALSLPASDSGFSVEGLLTVGMVTTAKRDKPSKPRHKRVKKIRLTAAEEEAHLRSQLALILPEDELHTDVEALVETLTIFAERERCERLEKALSSFVRLIDDLPVPPAEDANRPASTGT